MRPKGKGKKGKAKGKGKKGKARGWFMADPPGPSPNVPQK